MEEQQGQHWMVRLEVTEDERRVRSGVPSFVTAKTWICKELWGMVFIWYHADGEAPSWEIPADALPGTLERDASWGFEHRIRTHIQDIAENGADTGHFDQVHRASSLVDGREFRKTMGETWKGRMFQHKWTTSWRPLKHDAMVHIDTSISILGWKCGYLRYHVEARQAGRSSPGHHPPSRPETKYMLIQCLIPEGPLDIRVVHKVFFQPRMSWLVRWIYIMSLRNMVCESRKPHD
ncbi:cholesterol 7-desaturase nvd-like [Rhipicephalus sanguineus]|uniref:cholesterol 7-desaturase nvd-like n=1 Tax=Rhipicephalus sanguineus TaxID=34632 RepID=UPI0020C4CF75|nr:cholesterol 7-desaturase nvd-like [Rhipicephalus sanguineus]